MLHTGTRQVICRKEKCIFWVAAGGRRQKKVWAFTAVTSRALLPTVCWLSQASLLPPAATASWPHHSTLGTQWSIILREEKEMWASSKPGPQRKAGRRQMNYTFCDVQQQQSSAKLKSPQVALAEGLLQACKPVAGEWKQAAKSWKSL